MELNDFDYLLPEELIAQEPLSDRAASRLLHLDRKTGAIAHRQFRDLPEYLRAGDRLVLNDAKVIPARLLGKKCATGGRVEMLLTLPLGSPTGNRWRCIGQASKAIRPGARLEFDGLYAEVLAVRGEGAYDLQFEADDFPAAVERVGQIPLPPYIDRAPDAADRSRYQTVYAEKPGAAAAPTAGFHFTPELLERLGHQGIDFAKVTLYVGAGTFLPVRVETIETHRMHAERFEVSRETADQLARTRAAGGRVIAVGTTALRALETAASSGTLKPMEGESELFIYPGFSFHAVDGLITNFHLPKSTLLMLVSAFAGREAILEAYRRAVEARYRFFSYGDAMFLD